MLKRESCRNPKNDEIFKTDEYGQDMAKRHMHKAIYMYF